MIRERISRSTNSQHIWRLPTQMLVTAVLRSIVEFEVYTPQFDVLEFPKQYMLTHEQYQAFRCCEFFQIGLNSNPSAM